MRREDCHTFNLMAAGPAGSALAGQSRVLIHLADSRVIENTFWARRCQRQSGSKKIVVAASGKIPTVLAQIDLFGEIGVADLEAGASSVTDYSATQ